MAKFINKSGLEFVDISSEHYRTYTFPGGRSVTIDEPLKLNVSDSGGHRIFDRQGLSHYVPPGWLQLTWEAKPGRPHFVK